MEIIPKQISFQKNINEKITYYVEDDQIRLLIIVILLIGVILLISGTSGAYLFLLLGFGLVAFICLFKSTQSTPTQDLIETFTFQTLDISHLLTGDIGITEIEDHIMTPKASYHRVHPPIENCQIKFRNSIRNKK